MGTRVAIFTLGIASLLFAFANAHGPLPEKFGYSGSIGPAQWGKLSPLYSTCSRGKRQSPINIVKDEAIYDPNLHSLDRDYVPAKATLIDTGLSVMLKYGEEVGSVLVEGKNYTLKQMHWHTPSEHTIDGERFPAELHLVHVSKDHKIAVVAILYRYGKGSDPFLSKLQGKIGQLAVQDCDGEAHVSAGLVDTRSMRRGTRKYYRYVGSLTTPPCSENVVWSILGKVRRISREQVQALQAPLPVEYHRNARPVQPLNGRKASLFSSSPTTKKDSH